MRLLAFESFSRASALASPMPMAVLPFSNRFFRMNSVSSPPSIDSRAWWSSVMGHCVKASPPKMVSPMLSSGRSEMNSDATLRAASMRLGSRSLVNIDVETSTTSMMSMPSTERVSLELWVCGRARASTSSTKASRRSTGCTGISHTLQLRGALTKAAVSAMRMVGSVFLRNITYHII